MVNVWRIVKLFNKITVLVIKPGNIKLSPTETASLQWKRREIWHKPNISQSSSATKVWEYTVSGIKSIYHTSRGKPDIPWASDYSVSLVQTDAQRNKLQKIQNSGEDEGYSTITQEKNLMHADKEKYVIKRKTLNHKFTEFIKTGIGTIKHTLSVH